MVVDAHVTLCRHACVCMYWYVIEYIMYFSVFAYRSNVLCVLPTTLPNCLTDFLIVYVCMCMCVCVCMCVHITGCLEE